MARVQISRERWVIARKQWEGEPTASYQDISAYLGVSRQAVKQRADREGWQKAVDPAEVARKAHLAVDSKVSHLPANGPEQSEQVYLPPDENAESERPVARPSLAIVPPGTPPEQAGAVVEQHAVDVRTKVIDRHRTEWTAVRAKAYELIKKKGTPGGQEARALKALAESIKVIQDGERKAYGLDAGEPNKPGNTPAVQLIVNRKKGVTVGR